MALSLRRKVARRRAMQVDSGIARYPRPPEDGQNRLEPLSITPAIEMRITGWRKAYIPQAFLLYLDTCNKLLPSMYFLPWPYQIKLFAALFRAWDERKDIVVGQTRQSGKTDPTGRWLGYMVIAEGVQIVTVSTKVSKTRKMTRIIRSVMKADGNELIAEGMDETRFADNSGYVSLSGKKEAQRESDTAHIVVVDEAQDIPFSPTYGDLSPMRSGTKGIVIAMGIGGLTSGELEKASLITVLQEMAGVLQLGVWADEVIKDRPSYRETVEKDRPIMLPHEHAANYYGKNYPATGSTLMPVILPYDEVYPGQGFNADNAPKAMELRVGIDWGQKTDASALVAAAVRLDQRLQVTQAVLFRYAWFTGSYKQQLTDIVDILRELPYDVLRPELNGVGQRLEEDLYEQVVEAGLLNDPRGNLSSKIWQPIYATKETNSEVAKQISILSHCQGLLYVEDKGGYCARCITNLKGVGASYDIKNMIKVSHSDWFAALRSALYPEQVGQRRG